MRARLISGNDADIIAGHIDSHDDVDRLFLTLSKKQVTR